MRRQVVGLVTAALAVTACAGNVSETTSSTSSAATSTTSPAATTSIIAPTTTTVSTSTSTPSTTSPESERVEIVVEDGVVVGGVVTIEVELESEVEIRVFADVTENVHVHGYDLFADVSADEPAELEFVADVPGIFEIELEDSHLLIAELEVS